MCQHSRHDEPNQTQASAVTRACQILLHHAIYAADMHQILCPPSAKLWRDCLDQGNQRAVFTKQLSLSYGIYQ